MRQWMSGVAVAAGVALLLGCAASGVKVTDAQLAQLRPKQTTLADAERALGQPTTRMRMGDGTTMLHYVYAEASVRAASFIPVVGMVAGGTDVRSNSVMLRFDQAGLLVDVTSSNSQIGSGYGLSSGTIDRKPVEQPRQ